MTWPWVSRERLEETRKLLFDRERRIRDLEEKLLALVDRIAEIKVDPLTIPAQAKREADSFVLPPEVMEAIQARSIPGSKTEVRLRNYAKSKLSNGDSDPKDVAEEILIGSEAFKDEDW